MKRLFFVGCLGLLSLACSFTAEQIPLTPTPDIPSVQFQFPNNNAQVFEGTDLSIELLASDNTQGIARIELYVDALTDSEPYQTASPVAAEAVPVFTARMNWLAQGIGRHQFTAVAFRPDGFQSDEVTIVVEVIPREDVATASP
ncbi:MAG: Ig-like domain-containing protein [Chloroflexota bacterium]